MKVSHVMRTPVTTVEPKETVHIAEGIMALGGFRHLPVVVDGELVGIVTDRDLLRAPAVLTHLHGIDDTRAAGRALRVEDLMSKPVVTVGPETALAEAADVMLRKGLGSLPVLERGSLVAILTRSDIMRGVARSGAESADGAAPTTALQVTLERPLHARGKEDS